MPGDRRLDPQDRIPRGTGAVHIYDPDTACFLETIYRECNIPGRLDRDPLALVAAYPDIRDREIAGLVASVLAFGSVDLILRACRAALAPLGSSPAGTLLSMSDQDIGAAWAGFQYRFMFPKDMAALMLGMNRAISESGSLEEYFLSGDSGGEDIAAAAGAFARGLRTLGGEMLRTNLLPDPESGSACKRLLLYLRWMVRADAVDPGGWNRVSRARLLVPLDTHMWKTCRDRLGFPGTAAPTMKAARLVTAAFRLYSPGDPVKYDFALTRPGIDPKPGDEKYGCL